MINLEAFAPFLEAELNAELKNAGKFGVLLLSDGVWIPTEITEDDFIKYDHFLNPIEQQEEGLNLAAAAISTNHPAWPLVIPTTNEI